MRLLTNKPITERIGIRLLLLNLFFAPLVAVLAVSLFVGYSSFVQPSFDKYRDVLINVSSVPVIVTDKTVVLRVFGQKNLDCYYVRKSEVGYVYHNDLDDSWHWEEIEFSYVEDPSPGSNRPKSEYIEDMGLWQWKWSQHVKEPAMVRLTVEHICNHTAKEVMMDGKSERVVTGDLRTTVIGPFSISGDA